MMPVEPTEERMIRWEEIVRGHPLLVEFLGGGDFTNPKSWLSEVGNYTRQLEDQLSSAVGTDWEDKVVKPLHKDCTEMAIFSPDLPVIPNL